MKKLILRKPKWMRNDQAMRDMITLAYTIIEPLGITYKSVDEEMWIMAKAGECIKQAAKYGGFFTVEAFIKYMKAHPETY